MVVLFLDANVLVSAIMERDRRAVNLVFSEGHSLITNEYAIKETRRALLHAFGLSQEEAGNAIDRIRSRCIVLPSPSAESCRKIIIDDHSDRPIVAGAIAARAALLTYDHKLRVQARKYVETKMP